MNNFAHMGIDDRATMKGLRRNDFASNINAFSADDRLEDQYYYRNMPMNTNATDPANAHIDKQKQSNLRDTLLHRIQDLTHKDESVQYGVGSIEANHTSTDTANHTATGTIESSNLQTVTAPAQDNTFGSSNIDRNRRDMFMGNKNLLHNMSASWEGFFDDMQRWERLPAVGTVGKLRHVLTNENRFSYIIGVIVIVLLIIVIARVMIQ